MGERRMSARLLALGAALALSTTLVGCDVASTTDDEAGASDSSGASGEQSSAPPTPVRITTNAPDPNAVRLAAPFKIRATQGSLDSVTVSAVGGAQVEGRMVGHQWELDSRLEPGTDYVARAQAERSDGEVVSKVVKFHTENLTLDQQTYPSVAPLGGETVGVGMPVIVAFDLPVADRASFEQHMSVTSTPAQQGAWHWLNDSEVHWRPKSYWQAGTDVSVDIDINSLPAGKGIYGQESRTVEFHVGDANIYRVDAQTHQMRVFSNGSLLRTIPVTTGKAGFTTRSGTKVIMEKFAEKRMNSETVGIASDDPESYDIDDVQWAMRVTASGEFIHAAPWSVGSQGRANVSHGCTGLSTADAGWLYAMTKRGDVVEYTGTDASMSLENGYGDWNLPFDQYRAGSALH